MAKNRSHGKIDKLPIEIKRNVEKRLIKGETYDQISKYLKSLGYDISLHSVFRYGKPFIKRYEKIKDSLQLISLYKENNPHDFI
jgi:hypothetical protein